MTVKIGKGAAPVARGREGEKPAVSPPVAARRSPKLFSPSSQGEGRYPQGARTPEASITQRGQAPGTPTPATAPQAGRSDAGQGPGSSGGALQRSVRSAPDGADGSPATALFTAPQREAARVQREGADEQFFDARMREFKALPRPEQISRLQDLRQTLSAQEGGSSFLRRAEGVQAGLTGRMLDVPPLPEDIEESAKVTYDALKLSDISRDGGALRTIREEAWQKAIQHQRDTYPSPGSQSILSTLRWAEAYEQEKAIPELKAQTDPKAFDAMKKAYEQFNGKKVREFGPDWSQETNRENYDLYRAAKHAQDRLPEFALVSPEGVGRALRGQGLHPPPADSDAFAAQAISASLEVEKEHFDQLRSGSDEHFYNLGKLAVEAIEGAPLAPMRLGNASRYIAAAATAQRAFQAAEVDPALKAVSPSRILLARWNMGDKKPESPDQLLRSAADLPQAQANHFDLAIQAVESIERGGQGFSANLNEFLSPQNANVEAQKGRVFNLAKELDDTKDPDFATLKAQSFSEALALKKEFSPDAPMRIAELAKIASFWQKNEGDHDYQATRAEQQELWEFLKLPVEQRYQALGYAGDYLRDTSGTALRDLVRAAGGSPREQEQAQIMGSILGTTVSTTAARRNPYVAGVVAGKAIAGGLLHIIRDRKIQNDQQAVQKFFKRQLTTQTSWTDKMLQAYWYGMQERFAPPVRG